MFALWTLTFILEADRSRDRGTGIILHAMFLDGVHVRDAIFPRLIDRRFLVTPATLLIRTKGSLYVIAFLRFRAWIAESCMKRGEGSK